MTWDQVQQNESEQVKVWSCPHEEHFTYSSCDFSVYRDSLTDHAASLHCCTTPKTFCTNHDQAPETPTKCLQDARQTSQPFLTAFINTTCSYIDCYVLCVLTSHLAGQTVWNQLCALLLRGLYQESTLTKHWLACHSVCRWTTNYSPNSLRAR